MTANLYREEKANTAITVLNGRNIECGGDSMF
jgi:hypothetical protein